MTKNVEDMTQRMLREIQATLAEHGKLLSRNSTTIEAMRKEMHDWQETVATASGFAVHANVRNQHFEVELKALRKRVEKLEKA